MFDYALVLLCIAEKSISLVLPSKRFDDGGAGIGNTGTDGEPLASRRSLHTLEANRLDSNAAYHVCPDIP